MGSMKEIPHLTHWGRVTHICVFNLTIIGSDNGLSPSRRQAIIWTNDGILLIETLATKFSEMTAILSRPQCVKFRWTYMKEEIVWRKHENMSPCTGSRINTNYERIASWGGCQYWTGDPRISETPLAPTVVGSVLTTRSWPMHLSNGLANEESALEYAVFKLLAICPIANVIKLDPRQGHGWIKGL